MEILTWNFRKILFWENFSEFLCKPRLSSTKTCEISPYFLQFLYWVRIALTNFTQVLPYVVCTQVRRQVHKRITKKRYGEENPGCFVFGKPVLCTLGLGLTTPYSLGVRSAIFTRRSSLCLLSFRWHLRPRFVPQDWQSIFYWSLPGPKGRFVCVWNCLIFFVGEYSSCLTWNLSRFVPNSVDILTCNFRKKLFRDNCSEILCKPRLSSTKTCEISPYFFQFLLWIRIALKNFTQVLPYVVCTQVRTHAHKRMTKRRYGEENPGRFVFGKPVLFTLGMGLTTPYSLGVSVWNFYQTFATVSNDFGWDLRPRFVPQDWQ